MLTIFSTAKSFEGPFRTIQRNALASWTNLGPEVEVILFGDDPGSRQVCEELGITHVPGVRTTPTGAPMLSDMFRQAEALATNDTMCFINADIILTTDVLPAVAAARNRFEQFLMVAQRRDIDVDHEIAFEPGWDATVRDFAFAHGELKSEIWIDWFVYRKGLYGPLPELAIGRTGHDNWLIWRAGQLGAAIVDATPDVTLVHQRHDFSHAGGRVAVFAGEEAQNQRRVIGSWRHYHTIFHAQWALAGGAIVPAEGWKYRLARPKRLASHLLRFTRPIRLRLHGELGTMQRRRQVLPPGSG
jgi:hypothetical protein